MVMININDMNLDLFKYIMKLSVIPMMFISLLLITQGDADNITISTSSSYSNVLILIY